MIDTYRSTILKETPSSDIVDATEHLRTNIVEKDSIKKPFLISILAWAFISIPVAYAEDTLTSEFGPNDRIGALNYVTPEKTLRAVQFVTAGKVYPLGMITGPDTPAYGNRNYSIKIHPVDDNGAPLGDNAIVGNDDVMEVSPGIGTQIDGFAHIGVNHRYYNNVPASEIYSPDGVKVYGTHLIPPIATRGVILDMARAENKDRLDPGDVFNSVEIKAAAAAQRITLEKGDIVLFHTGWLSIATENPEAFIPEQPGLGVEGAEYLASIGVVAVGSDTAGLEVYPFEDANSLYPVHTTLLPKNGVYILENVNTHELIKDGVDEFLLVIGTPRFEGAVQMVINPVAIK